MTPIVPPAWTVLQHAIRQRLPVALAYHGHIRVVCPHALGWKNQKPLLLAYQIGGHTHRERQQLVGVELTASVAVPCALDRRHRSLG